MPCLLPKGYTVLLADLQDLGRCRMMLHLASCCSKRWELIESPLGVNLCASSVSEAGQADVSIWLFCVTLGAVFSLFFTISVPPDKSQTCSMRKPVARGRDIILPPLLRDARAALLSPVNGEQGKHFPWLFILKQLFSICFCILFLKWAGH